MISAQETAAGTQPAIVSLNKWLADAGVSSITAWRWRKKGWLPTVNIAGRVYLTSDGIAQFTRRAAGGEFAQEHKVPAPHCQ